VQQKEFDKLGNITISLFFEKRGNGNYYLLKRSEFTYDSRGNKIIQTDFLFDTPILTADIGNFPDREFTTAQTQNAVTALATQFFYDRNKRLFRQVNALGQVTTWQYDGTNRRILVQDDIGNYSRTLYDENSNVIRVDRHEMIINPLTGAMLGEEVFSTLHEYDSLDRRIATTDGLGSRNTFTYDSRNNLASVIDPLGNTKRYTYDIFGRKTFETVEMTRTGLGGGMRLPDIVTQYVFDDNDRLASLIDANGNTTQFEFDDLNRQFRTTYGDSSTLQLSYDPDDNVIVRKDNNGLQIVYQVDALSRRKRVTLDSTLLNPQFPYPSGAETFEQYSYDGLGRPTQQINDYCQIITQFNSMGRGYNESVQFTSPYPAPAGALFIIRKYDRLLNRSDITYPSGRSVHYDYDRLNRIQRMTNTAQGANYPGSGGFPVPYDIATFEYRGLRLGKTSYGNQTLTRFAYDGAARLISTRHEDANGPFFEIQQLFDRAGNRRFELDIPAAPGRPNGERYSFDSLYRLTQVVPENLVSINPAQFAPPNAPLASNALNGQQAIDTVLGPLAQAPLHLNYQYDNVGNRQRVGFPGQPSVVYTINDLNQYTTIARTQFKYDLNGNLIDDGRLRYSYNYKNQLVRVLRRATNTELLRLLYDAVGRLIVVRQSGQTTSLINDGLSVAEEYDADIVAAQYVYESGVDQRCQIATARQELWYHRDILRSTRALSNSVGNVLPNARFDYSPFGLLLGALAQPNRYLFAGKRLFEAVGLYDSRTRYYSPILGRFLQRDPNGMADDPNLYTYSNNNPTSLIDLMGTEKSSVASRGGAIFDPNDSIVYTQDPQMALAIRQLTGDSMQLAWDLTTGAQLPAGAPGGTLVMRYDPLLSGHVPNLIIVGGYDVSRGSRNYFISPEGTTIGETGIITHVPASIVDLGISFDGPTPAAFAKMGLDAINIVTLGAGLLEKTAISETATAATETAITKPQVNIVDTNVLVKAMAGNQNALNAIRSGQAQVTFSQLREFLDVSTEVQQTQRAQFLLEENITPLSTSYGQLTTSELRDTFWEIAKTQGKGDTTGDAAMVIHGLQSGFPIVTGDQRLINLVQGNLGMTDVKFTPVTW
jgi:RHS repeat-associated protein